MVLLREAVRVPEALHTHKREMPSILQLKMPWCGRNGWVGQGDDNQMHTASGRHSRWDRFGGNLNDLNLLLFIILTAASHGVSRLPCPVPSYPP